MPILNFEIEINATPEKVWNTLWQEESYKKWAGTLNEGSYYEGNFQQNSKIYFYDPERNGMYNLVEKNIPNREMAFKHLGWIMNGEEAPKNWENSGETYLLEETEKGTLLKIEVNALDEFVDFFNSKYPTMLATVKQLAEE